MLDEDGDPPVGADPDEGIEVVRGRGAGGERARGAEPDDEGAAGGGAGSQNAAAGQGQGHRSGLQDVRGADHGRTDALIGGAAADIAGHRRLDLLRGGSRRPGQQIRRLHDLARLAVAALHHVELGPGLPQRLAHRAREPLEGGHGGASHILDQRLARPDRDTVEMHGAGAAGGDAAAVFRAREPEFVAQHPQQRRAGFGQHLAFGTVQGDREGDEASLPAAACRGRAVGAGCRSLPVQTGVAGPAGNRGSAQDRPIGPGGGIGPHPARARARRSRTGPAPVPRRSRAPVPHRSRTGPRTAADRPVGRDPP